MAPFFAKLIAGGAVPLPEVLKAVLEVPPLEEDGDPPLVDAGHGVAFVFDVLSR